MITVYTKPNCVQCDQTKKVLDMNNIEYETIDITQNGEALQKVLDMGFQSAPVVVTDNDSWAGLRIDKLKELVMNH
jgi:glutaredoxin-like protein NrdH